MTQDALQTDYRSILRLALPVSAGTFMQFLVVLTDNYFLSRTSDVLGRRQCGRPYITLAMIGAGFCNTGQILIARDGRRPDGANLSILSTGLRGRSGGPLPVLFVALLQAGFAASSGWRDGAARIYIRKWGYLPSFLVMMLNAFFMGTARSRPCGR